MQRGTECESMACIVRSLSGISKNSLCCRQGGISLRAFYRLPPNRPNRATHAHKCSTSVCFIVRKSGRFQHLVCLEEESSLMGRFPSSSAPALPTPVLVAAFLPPSLETTDSWAKERKRALKLALGVVGAKSAGTADSHLDSAADRSH